MIVSHKWKFVMLLPWKTASQTTVARLSHLDESKYPKFFYFNSRLNRIVHQHITWADFAALPESQLGYFTASFIRNPYDRIYSGFQQLKRDIAIQPTAAFPEKWIRDMVLDQIAENSKQLIAAGYEFDRWIQLIREDQVLEQGRNTNFPLHPAHYWTHMNGIQMTNFIGKVESFDEDFNSFAAILNLHGLPNVNANVSESKNPEPGMENPYKYLNRMAKKSIDKINYLFRSDFEILGYEIMNSKS